MPKIENAPADPSPFSFTFPCLAANQPIGELFSGVIPGDILYSICEFDVRRVIYESRDVERYLGIQRPLSPGRVKDIADYVTYMDATFPSAIIIAVDSRCAEFDPASSRMTLHNVMDPVHPVAKRSIARVIDGQHRVAGLQNYKKNRTDGKPFECLVTILIDADIADQGHIFATVNLAQTKVNRSLAIDLYALEQSRSPLKTCHSVVVAMDKDQKGPFFKRIKRLGLTTKGRQGETLSQATVVDGLVPYISADPDADRDAILRGRRLAKVDPSRERKLIFRNFFIDGEDGKIAIIFSDFFDAVRARWPKEWNEPKEGEILCRTTGYLALSKLFGEIYNDLFNHGHIPSAENFLEILLRSKLPGDQFTATQFLPGTSGQTALYKQLLLETLGREI